MRQQQEIVAAEFMHWMILCTQTMTLMTVKYRKGTLVALRRETKIYSILVFVNLVRVLADYGPKSPANEPGSNNCAVRTQNNTTDQL